MKTRSPLIGSLVLATALVVLALPAVALTPPPPRFDPNLIAVADTNNDEQVTFDEAKAKLPSLTQEQFDRMDANHDGVLTLEDASMPSPADILRRLLTLAYGNDDYSVTFAEMQALMSELNQAQFDEMDRNDDGALTWQDLPMAAPYWPLPVLYDFLQHLDANHDGQVTLAEAEAQLLVIPYGLFNALDRNDDGVLSLADVPEIAPTGPADALKRLIEEADTNDDGTVTFEEAQAKIPALTQEKFNFLDRNGDGVLTADDLPDLPPLSPLDILKKIVHEADANEDGAVSFDEAKALWPALTQEQFDQFDQNDDGVLSEADLPAGPPSPQDILQKLLNEADTNSDGAISFEEAVAIVPALTQEQFDKLDRNDDGVLTLQDVPDQPGTGPVAALEFLLREADANGDHQLSLEEVQALLPNLTQEQFDELDRNDDGVLTGADLPLPPVENVGARIVWLLRNADANSDNALTLEELQAVFPNFTQAAFDYLDRNDDGVLSPTDAPLGPPADPLELLKALLRAADADKDGNVTFDELKALCPELSQERFDEMDRNDDGVLNGDDFPERPEDGLEHLLEVLRSADANSDKQVTFEELSAKVPGLTQEQFDKLDRNGDGVISAADLPEPGDIDPFRIVVKLLHEADADDDGQVTFAEAQALFEGLTQEKFDALDRNDDGVLTPADVPMPPAGDLLGRLVWFLNMADADSNQQVTLAEIQALVPEFTQEAFDALDKNDDGVLSPADLPSRPPENPEEALRRLLREADANDDGQVTFDELKTLAPEVTQEQFDALDKNDDGVLTEADIPDFPDSPMEWLLRFLAKADANADGQVTFAEFQAVVPDGTQEQFDTLDQNDDGVITREDLPKPPVDPLKRFIELLKEADADENGEVTFDELKAVAPDLTQEQFDTLDKNDDGVITRNDLPQPPRDPRVWLLDKLREADANGDGQVTFDELNALLPDLTQERFDEFDRNDDGVLTEADIPETPLPPDSDSRKALLRALVRADLNRDGRLEFSEIQSVFPDAPSELLDEVDTNDDWVITRAELMAALGISEGGQPIVPPQDIDANGATNAIDVQHTINQILGFSSDLLLPDVDGNDTCNVVDVQQIINRILGLG